MVNEQRVRQDAQLSSGSMGGLQEQRGSNRRVEGPAGIPVEEAKLPSVSQPADFEFPPHSLPNHQGDWQGIYYNGDHFVNYPSKWF